MSDLDVFRDEYLLNVETASITYAQWKKQQPGEYKKWVSYRDALLAEQLPEPPTLTSRYGKMLMAAGHLAERDDMKVTLNTSGGTTDLSGSVTITASPVPSSQVTSVSIYVDDVLKVTDASAPFTYVWNTVVAGEGAHQLKAVALYPRNKRAEGKLSVTVKNAPAPEPPDPPIQGVPVNSALPAISGTATEGQSLSVSAGTWTNLPTSYTRQWLRCDAAGANPVAIPSATGISYVLVAADVGATIRCAVTAFNSVGASAVATSAQTAVVASLAPAVPVIVTVPVISGTATQGSALSVSNGNWTNSPTSYSRQWKRCNSSGASCVNISGATATTYVLVAADVGSTIRCVVTATNVSGASTGSQSSQTAVIAEPPVVSPTPAPPEAPRAPVGDRSNPSGLGFNVSSGSADIHDYRIHDTGDTAILLHQTQQNGIVRRVEISRLIPTVGWAIHGVYAKSPGNLLEDIRVDNSQGQGGAGITLRMQGNIVRRVWIGGGFVHPITYFEHSGVAGEILIEDAELHYTNTQTCIWGDDSNEPPTPGLKQKFVLRRVHAFGPVNAKLVRFANYTGAGVTLEDCFINGRAATMADVELLRL